MKPVPTRLPSLRLPIVLAWTALALAVLNFRSSHAAGDVGLPFNRSYSVDEIGVSRGVLLGFDPIDRLVVLDSNKYVVLNDSRWINLLPSSPQVRNLHQVANDHLGNTYFGALASWGILKRSPDGSLLPVSLRPEDAPAWVNSTNFDFVFPFRDGMVFGGLDGVVFWKRDTGSQTFVAVPDVARVFALGNDLFVSSHTQGVNRLDLETATLHPVQSTGSGPTVIDRVATAEDGTAIVSTTGRRFARFDGHSFPNWENDLGAIQTESITNILSLPDGEIAISIDGNGLYLLNQAGKCLLALTTPEYKRINHIACKEPGVLWVATENDVQKILYSDPVHILDQRAGLSVSWPQVVEWKGEPLVASSGALYQIASSPNSLSQRFERLEQQPPLGAMGVAVFDDQLLAGNGQGVYLLQDQTFIPIASGFEVNKLIKIGPDTCIAAGRSEIAVLQRTGKTWSEAAPRAPGLGFPFISIAAQNSAWIELGVGRVARIAFRHGQLHVREFQDLPWQFPSWIHVGLAGNLTILSGSYREHFVFDETTESIVASPTIETLFQTAPFPISRLATDRDGTIWAAYESGIFSAKPDGDSFLFDTVSYKTIHEHFPLVQLGQANSIWVSTGTTLYHVDTEKPHQRGPQKEPVLVSITNPKTKESLYSAFDSQPIPTTLPYAQNDLEFLFFGNSYAAARTPSYEFKMANHSNDWTVQKTDSAITLTNLSEGDYQLHARLVGTDLPLGDSTVARFSIRPPWFRSVPAYLGYAFLTIGTFLASIAFATKSAKRRQAYLESLVSERTEALRSTMEKLGEKERNEAILAERNRLASEIHDSVQQGLSGLALQLDATLKLPELAQAVRSRLAVARNMITYTRHEVQQAVWDLESPFLENNDLTEALQKIAQFIGSDSTHVDLHVDPTDHSLDSLAKHNLLRIAQEAITNAVRHGKAEHIRVELKRDQQQLHLHITDNGCGFDSHEALNNGAGHFGLRGMRARVAKINGRFHIDSAPNSGTRLQVSVPLTP